MSKGKATLEELLNESLIFEEEHNYKVSNNWVWVKLGSVIELISGRDLSAKECNVDEKGIPYIMGASNIKNNELIIERWIEKPTVVGKEGDILISVKGTIGKLLIQNLEFTHLSRQIMAIRGSNKVYNKYLYYFLMTYIENLKELSRGVIPGISREDILNAPFPLIPVNEQKRLVSKLENLLSKIDESKQLIKEAKDSFELRRAAILDKAFRGEFILSYQKEDLNMNSFNNLMKNIEKGRKGLKTEKLLLEVEEKPYEIPSDWKWMRLENILAEKGLFDGPFGSNLKTADYTDSGARVIRLENIGSLSFNDSKKSFISQDKYKKLKKHTVMEGDIIFASFITEKIRVCMLPQMETVAINKSDCFCVRPNINVIDKEFLLYFLSSNFSYDFLHSQIHGATRPRINLTQLKKLPIPIPTLKEQLEIVKKTKKLFRIENDIADNLNLGNYLDELKESILNKAFRGELGTNDPAEENAIELLKEVLKEKVK